jgi:hypothetical protein
MDCELEGATKNSITPIRNAFREGKKQAMYMVVADLKSIDVDYTFEVVNESVKAFLRNTNHPPEFIGIYHKKNKRLEIIQKPFKNIDDFRKVFK